MNSSLETLVRTTRAALASAGEVIGQADGKTPRYELFHAANSICSQKVRAVMAARDLPWLSHTMKLFKGQTYIPPYVRLRMIGCERIGASLMAVHTGSTSVSAGGCDPAVVPTLVDWRSGEVIVDSKRICFHLDDSDDGPTRLRPRHLAARIDAQLEIVDNLPNIQMLSGTPPGADLRPATRPAGSGVEFAMSKVERCDRYLQEFPDDPDLVRGYTAKRAKELTAARQLFTPEAMREAYSRAESGCEGLERLLERRSSRWMFGDDPTMADLFWAIELIRIRNMGAERFWADGKLPAVEAFLTQAEALPSLRAAVIDWPGALF